jgi:hypothetical protein
MALWEKVIVNVERGAKRVAVSAAFFSERVRAEIALARLRIRLHDVQSLIREQEALIGRTVVSLRKKGELPEKTDMLLREEFIVTALAEIEAREKDVDDIRDEIAHEQTMIRAAEKSAEEKAG